MDVSVHDSCIRLRFRDFLQKNVVGSVIRIYFREQTKSFLNVD